ncbi:unnamed protein product [Calypogeia fissa]
MAVYSSFPPSPPPRLAHPLPPPVPPPFTTFDVGVVNALAQIEGIGDCGELQITLQGACFVSAVVSQL